MKDGERTREGLGRNGWLSLGGLVAGLVLLVWWAIPTEDKGAAPATSASAETPSVEAAEASAPRRVIDHPPEAIAELAVLTSSPDFEVQKIANADAIANLLETRHCGGTCDVLKNAMKSRDTFEVEVTTAADYILPPRDAIDTVAAGLSPAERATVYTRPAVVVIKTRGPADTNHLAARIAFATTAAVSEALSGVIYDEVTRRIQTTEQFLYGVITAPMGEPVFSARHIVLQLYRMDDGTARILTLGMVRFGCPDFSIRGARMTTAPRLSHVVNAVASMATQGKTGLPLTVSLGDVAVAAQKRPDELSHNPPASTPIVFDVADGERTEGDPENEMIDLVPTSGTSPEAFDAAVNGLFGEPPPVVFAEADKELDEVAARARARLGGAIRQFEHGDGSLFVKGPFPIAASARVDGGPTAEWMWIEVASCAGRSCTGSLSNSPGYATNFAAGDKATVDRDKAADWLLHLRDGGTLGGESIQVLERRAPSSPPPSE